MERVKSTRRRVGYRNPPLHTRFKKGESGNPSGLPKEGNERRRSASTQLAMRRALLKKAASGDAAAARLLWQMDRASAAEDSKLSTPAVLNTEADKLVVEQLVLRLRAQIKGEDNGNNDNG